jgi:hypothetical protein
LQFDDRLATVLDQSVDDPRARAVQWRQLVDLIARGAPAPGSPLVMRAMQRIAEGSEILPEELRAAAARAVAGLNLPVALVAIFAADSLSVSAPVIAAARLDAAEWDSVLDGVGDETRAFAETVHPELRKSPKPKKAEPEAPPEPPAKPRRWKPPAEEAPKISEMVARIERMRRMRGPAPSEPHEPPSSAAMSRVSTDSPALFRWECGPSGDIAWVEGAPRGALIGRSIALAGNGEGEGVDRTVERAFALRSPFRDASFSLAGEGILSGRWRISGVPAFEPSDGRFAGYRGVARREEAMPSPAGAMPAPPSRDHDSLRELVHEIKTPLNAIIGFAEIIDGQYLGPAHRSYRQRAAEIVSQARTLLGAIDDLDFAAKLQSSRSSPGEGTDFAEILPHLTEEFTRYAATRGAEISTRLESAFHRCALEPELSERLIRRFVESVLDAALPSEELALGIGSQRGNCALTITRPAAIRVATEEQLFDPAFALSPDDTLGIGFALRLVRGLARIAGGDLRVDPERLVLLLPAVRA